MSESKPRSPHGETTDTEDEDDKLRQKKSRLDKTKKRKQDEACEESSAAKSTKPKPAPQVAVPTEAKLEAKQESDFVADYSDDALSALDEADGIQHVRNELVQLKQRIQMATKQNQPPPELPIFLDVLLRILRHTAGSKGMETSIPELKLLYFIGPTAIQMVHAMFVGQGEVKWSKDGALHIIDMLEDISSVSGGPSTRRYALRPCFLPGGPLHAELWWFGRLQNLRVYADAAANAKKK